MTFDFDDRVVVRHTHRTEADGTSGRHGRIAGKSYEDDDPGNRVLAYAVAMDDDGRTWMVEPNDLQPEQ